MVEKSNTVIFTPGAAFMSEEFDQCRKLLEMFDTAHYINDEGASVMCSRGESADDITIIISPP